MYNKELQGYTNLSKIVGYSDAIEIVLNGLKTMNKNDQSTLDLLTNIEDRVEQIKNLATDTRMNLGT